MIRSTRRIISIRSIYGAGETTFVIKKDMDTITIENPGSIVVGKNQMLKGGISEPRNKAIMKMFNLIRIGERAGSGVPDIFTTWENEGWIMPEVEEQYKPDRTILKLSFVSKAVSPDFQKSDHALSGKGHEKGHENEAVSKSDEIDNRRRLIFDVINEVPSISIPLIAKRLDINEKTDKGRYRLSKKEWLYSP